MAGITSESILELIENESKMVCEKEELSEVLLEKKPEVLLTVGAGDIGVMVPKIAELFKDVSSNDPEDLKN